MQKPKILAVDAEEERIRLFKEHCCLPIEPARPIVAGKMICKVAGDCTFFIPSVFVLLCQCEKMDNYLSAELGEFFIAIDLTVSEVEVRVSAGQPAYADRRRTPASLGRRSLSLLWLDSVRS